MTTKSEPKPPCTAKHPGGGHCVKDADHGHVNHIDPDGRRWNTDGWVPPGAREATGICEVVKKNKDGTFMVRMDADALGDLWSEFGCAGAREILFGNDK